MEESVFEFDSGPHQLPISRDGIAEMLQRTPRRMRLASNALKAPGEFGTNADWNLIFPFRETFVPAFEAAFPLLSHIPFRQVKSGKSWFSFLKNVSDLEVHDLKAWMECIQRAVGISDCLAVSFALDFDCVDGNPSNARSAIGQLRERAKPYNVQPTSDTFEAAEQLVTECVSFLVAVRSYDCVDCVVAVPSSHPSRPYHLAEFLAKGISSRWSREDFSMHAKSVCDRMEVKNTPIAQKMATLEGTITCDATVFKGRNVLLVDDLYQSGVTMNYVGMLLLDVGAKRVLGLSCDKTCRNDDNAGMTRRR